MKVKDFLKKEGWRVTAENGCSTVFPVKKGSTLLIGCKDSSREDGYWLVLVDSSGSLHVFEGLAYDDKGQFQVNLSNDSHDCTLFVQGIERKQPRRGRKRLTLSGSIEWKTVSKGKDMDSGWTPGVEPNGTGTWSAEGNPGSGGGGGTGGLVDLAEHVAEAASTKLTELKELVD